MYLLTFKTGFFGHVDDTKQTLKLPTGVSSIFHSFYLICGDRGFFYSPSKINNDTESSFGFLTGKSVSETEIDGFPFKQQDLDKENEAPLNNAATLLV
uniref:Uncharacterized protein n=1 Tax=Erpetoichthys calabaricus TaxID=27687 RepID=A0A8C4SN44_ERPCA